MKSRLLISHSLLFVIMVGLAITNFERVNPWINLTLVIIALAIVMFIFRNWRSYIDQLLEKSNRTLNKLAEETKSWFDKLDQLNKNQDQVIHKFKVSADLITNLAHPEKMGALSSFTSDDPIGKAIHSIRLEMKKLKDEDEKQAWIAQGLAQFSTILRNKSEIKQYANQIIGSLIKYLNANQGGLFIEHQDYNGERYLELVGCYAYGKRRYVDAKITEGQGLLGQCMLEKDFIFITDVPKDYIKITSGLGEATPRNVIVNPLIFNNIFYGAIEIASFETLQEHQIDFIKKVCENIASEIATLKNVEHTKGLLDESNTLTQELQSREEEMKQNLEELAATQEEMSRKQTELTGVINAIDSTLATVELDVYGRILKHNSILENFLGYGSSQLVNKNYTLITGNSNEDVSWNKIATGIIKAGDFKTTSSKGSEVWLSVTFTPIQDINGATTKLLCMIQDITHKKNKEREFERLSLVANNTDNSVIITDQNGLIEYVNDGFAKLTGYELKEVIGKKPGKILQGTLTDQKTVKKLRESIAAGISVYEEILNYNKRGESYWVSVAINPVKDEKGNTTKFISIQSDITQTKIKALDFHQKMQAISRANAIIELDKNGRLIDINDNYLELLNYNREELIGKPYSVLTHKENTFQKVLDTIDEHGLQSGTYSRYDKNGNRHSMKLMDYPVLNFKGEIEKIIEFGVDVSNEKRLEREAELRQAELKSYLSGINNTIASAEFDLNGNLKDANDIFLKIMGFGKEELVEQSFEFLMGDDQSVIMMWENLRLGKFFSGEFKMKNKSDKELWLTGTFNPIMIESNKPEKFMMFAQFTTQEKEKMNDLSTMVQVFKSTLPIMEFTQDFNCKTANEKALKILGLSKLELRSKTILDFLPSHYHTIWNKSKKEILSTELRSMPLPIIGNGQVMNYEVSISIIQNIEGGIGKILFVLTKELGDKVPALAAM
jgi:PAS domain S-box-containing protein